MTRARLARPERGRLGADPYSTVNTAGPQTMPRTDLGPQTDIPRMDWLGSVATGYGNRPFTGSTVFVRMFYLF